MASKSRRPALRRSWNMTRNSCSISRATSWRIASAVFSLGAGRFLLDWPQTANLFIDLHKGAGQLLIFAELRDLLFGFPHGGRSRQCLADGLALHLVGEPQRGTVARIIRLSTMTGPFATTTHDSGNTSGPKVAEPGKLHHKIGTLLFEIGERWGLRQVGSFILNVSHTFSMGPQKKEAPYRALLRRAPRRAVSDRSPGHGWYN